MPLCSVLSRPMIKQTVINKANFLLGAALVFLIGYILQLNLTVPLLLVCMFSYFKSRNLALRKFRFLYLLFLFVVNFTVAYLIIAQDWSVYFIPLSAVAILTTLLFNNLEVSLLVTLVNSITVASVSKNFFQVAILFLISSISSSILVLGARKRVTIIRSGAIVGVLQAVSLVFLDRFWIGFTHRYLILMVNGIASSGIALLLLPLFEYLFKAATSISLLELADFHHPLLQRMILEAPGTFHHSLVVGNLSETACNAVGANALLARIGAYYHDIGKLEKTEYFSENQEVKESKHDALSPAMSKIIIMNHVKEGAELGRKYKLSPPLIDFILQHHGTSLVYYFYRRALEAFEEDQGIKEEGFRYPGPRPNTKETAIVLLADSVEAATRALRNPSPNKIEEIVHKVINNKFIDGQLDECDLTLKDIEKISAVFIRILSGIYRSRIGYPEESGSQSSHPQKPKGSSKEEASEDNDKKFSKEDPRQSEKDKKSNS